MCLFSISCFISEAFSHLISATWLSQPFLIHSSSSSSFTTTCFNWLSDMTWTFVLFCIQFESYPSVSSLLIDLAIFFISITVSLTCCVGLSSFLICHIMSCSGYCVTRAHVFVSAWYQATVALREMKVDQLAKETLDQDINPLASARYTDLKPLVNSYIQHLVQTKWDVAVHGRDFYLVKSTLGQPKKFQLLTRAEEVVITRLCNTHATKSDTLSRGPPTACNHCGQALGIDHMLLECAVLQECSDEYYTAHWILFFETIPETCIVKFLR